VGTAKAIDTPLGRVSYAEYGEGPPRVFLHSLLTDRSAFDLTAREMKGKWIMVDLPGFGSSAMAQPNIDDYAHRIAALLTALGLERPVLIGNGLGGFVALAVAIHHPELIERLILIGAGAGVNETQKQAFAGMAAAVTSGGMEAVIPTALRRLFSEDYLAANPRAGEQRAEVLRRTAPEAFVLACEALAALDYTALAPNVEIPTLIVVGEGDQATPPLLAVQLHELIDGSQLVRLEGIAHAPQLQDPVGLAATLISFLEER